MFPFHLIPTSHLMSSCQCVCGCDQFVLAYFDLCVFCRDGYCWQPPDERCSCPFCDCDAVVRGARSCIGCAVGYHGDNLIPYG